MHRYGTVTLDAVLLIIALTMLATVRITWLDVICLVAAYVVLTFGVVRIGRAGSDGDPR